MGYLGVIASPSRTSRCASLIKSCCLNFLSFVLLRREDLVPCNHLHTLRVSFLIFLVVSSTVSRYEVLVWATLVCTFLQYVLRSVSLVWCFVELHCNSWIVFLILKPNFKKEAKAYFVFRVEFDVKSWLMFRTESALKFGWFFLFYLVRKESNVIQELLHFPKLFPKMCNVAHLSST